MGKLLLIGQRVCSQCDSTRDRVLQKFGVHAVKSIIDYENSDHKELLAKSEGYMSAPIIAYQHDDGTLTHIATGVSMYAQTATDRFIKNHLPQLAHNGE